MQTEILSRPRGRPIRTKHTRNLSNAELQRFLKETKRNRTLRLQFDLMLFCGLTPRELLTIRKSDVHNHLEITIKNKSYTLPTSIGDQLRRYLKHLPKSTPWLFPAARPEDSACVGTLQYRFKRLCAKAGLSTDLSLGVLRHTTGVRIVRAGGGLAEVQDWMRLKNLSAAGRYFSANSDATTQERKTPQVSYQKNPAGNIFRGVNEWT